MNFKSNLRSSIFDGSEDKTHFDFTLPDSRHQYDLESPFFIIDNLICKNYHTNSTREGVFALHNRLLVFYEDETTQIPKSVLDLSYSRVLPLPSSKSFLNFGIILVHNGNAFELYFTDKLALNHWVHAFKKICIMTTFHNDFNKIKTLKENTLGSTYLVESKTDGERYAVKAFTKERLYDFFNSNPKPALINEISILRNLDHENIVKLFEVHETENSVYLLLEHVEGKLLENVIKDGDFRVGHGKNQIASIISSLIHALAYISGQGIMHRDLVPSNIVVTSEGKVKINDCGLATYVRSPQQIYNRCGTPGYIAPEIFRFSPEDPSSAYNGQCDVFSLGCIFHYMLMGQRFFNDSSQTRVLQLNKESNGSKALNELKKEINNPDTKMDINALNLLICMLDFNPKTRILPSQAVNHKYLKIAGWTLTRLMSLKERFSRPEVDSFPTFSTIENFRYGTTGDSMNSLIPVKSASQGKNEYIAYTESARHDAEGDSSQKRALYYKSQSLRSGPQKHTQHQAINRNQSSQNDLIRSPTTPYKNKHILKAAILSNARKNKEESTTHRQIYNYEMNQKTEDSVDMDVGNDVCPLKMYFDQVNTRLSQKHPSKCLTHR